MNKKRKKRIESLQDRLKKDHESLQEISRRIEAICKDLNDISSELEELKDEEEECYGNIPEPLLTSNAAIESELAIGNMDDAIEYISETEKNMKPKVKEYNEALRDALESLYGIIEY